MKIAVFQGSPPVRDTASCLALLADLAVKAAKDGAGFLILPEMFLTGYDIGREAVHALAEPADGPSAQRVAEIARTTGVAVLYGYPERLGEAVFNAAQLIDGDGRSLANHRKSHLFGDVDRAVFTPGNAAATIAGLDGLEVGILICYEVEFPESVRILALAGADLIAVPTALMHPYTFVAQTLVRTRAYENQVFLAYANHCGEEGRFSYTGLSCVIAPDGAELARAGDGEALIVAELDLARQAESQRLNPYLRDRRPELYAALAAPPYEAGRAG